MRKNPRGVHREQWLHTQGCRRWFMATRDTVSYQFLGYETFGGAPGSAGAATNSDAQEGNNK